MADPILEVRDLSVTFHTAAGPVNAVRNVSWQLEKGETLAILGESGSGKSVSAAAIMNLIDMPPGEITSGEIRLDGANLLTMTAEQRRQINGVRIAMIFQDSLAHLNPVYTVGWQITEMMTTHGVSRHAARERAAALLERVGIRDPETRMRTYPHQFSGGQRQRLMIAMALSLKPDIIIADEPTTALDVTVQARILALLRELKDETGMSLVLITHDLGVVAEVADRVVVMNGGRIVEEGDAARVYADPTHPYTKKLIAAAPGKGKMRDAERRDDKPLITAIGITKSYGSVEALKNVDLTLMPGETVAIVGESGSGKSTLARCLLRLDDADAGWTEYNGADLFKMDQRALRKVRREIQMVFQDPTNSLNPRMSAYQLIAEAWAIHPGIQPKSEWRAKVADLLDKVGLSPKLADRYPHQFSGGQCQRIAIARALALEPRVIICDEAVSALDVSIQAQVIGLLADLRRDFGLSYLFIAHDLPVVQDFADRVVVMRNGIVVEQGSVKQIFSNPQDSYTQQLLAASLDPDPAIQAKRRRIRRDGLETAGAFRRN